PDKFQGRYQHARLDVVAELQLQVGSHAIQAASHAVDVAQHNVFIRGDVGPGYAPLAVQRVTRRAHGVQRIAIDDPRRQLVGWRLDRHDAKIGSTMTHVLDRVVRIQFEQVQLYAGMRAVIACYDVAQQAGHHQWRGRHAYGAALQGTQARPDRKSAAQGEGADRR